MIDDDTCMLFYLKDGRTIRTLEELDRLLSDMPEAVFQHHVQDGHNDFASWIQDVLHKDGLAKDVWECRSREEMQQLITRYLKDNRPWHQRLREGIKQWARTRQSVQEPADQDKPLLDDDHDEPRHAPAVQDEVSLTPAYLKSDIPGFDDLLNKGIPEGSSTLLCGGPGSGKTTFALHLLVALAKQGKKGLYLSFEESPTRLYHHMEQYGWQPAQLEEQGLLRILRLNPFDLSRSVEALLAKASGELAIELDELEGIVPPDFQPDIVFLDSLSAVGSAFIGKEQGYRAYVEQLFNLFERRRLTAFLISEVEQSTKRYSRSGVEEFLADGVIAFYNIRQRAIRVSALEIIKVRGIQHVKKIVPFKMLPGSGIMVYPQEEVFFT